MQASAEGYELLAATDPGRERARHPEGLDPRHRGAFWCWTAGLALEEDPDLSGIRGYVQDSGEGR